MDSPTGNTTVLTLNTCKKWTTLIQERQPLKFKFSCRRLIYDRSTTNFQRRRADSKNCTIKAHNRRSFLSSSGCVSDSFFLYPHSLTDKLYHILAHWKFHLFILIFLSWSKYTISLVSKDGYDSKKLYFIKVYCYSFINFLVEKPKSSLNLLLIWTVVLSVVTLFFVGGH